MTPKPTTGTTAPRLALTTDEAAAAIGVGRSTFYKHVLPELRVVRIGRRVLIRITELDRYLERQESRLLQDEIARIGQGGSYL